MRVHLSTGPITWDAHFKPEHCPGFPASGIITPHSGAGGPHSKPPPPQRSAWMFKCQYERWRREGGAGPLGPATSKDGLWGSSLDLFDVGDRLRQGLRLFFSRFYCIWSQGQPARHRRWASHPAQAKGCEPAQEGCPSLEEGSRHGWCPACIPSTYPKDPDPSLKVSFSIIMHKVPPPLQSNFGAFSSPAQQTGTHSNSFLIPPLFQL